MPVQRRWLIGGGVAAIVGVLAFAFWFAVIRGDAPPPVSLEGAVESLSAPTAASESSPTATASAEPAGSRGDLEGGWAVSSAGESFVGYRVRQTVAGVDAPTRVGRTPAVTAAFEVTGDHISALTLEADLLQLTSGDERRDVIFADLLETELFPTASFALSSAVPLGEVIAAEEASFDARLTLHGVTNDIRLSLVGSVEGELVILVGSTEIAFVDFGIDRPTVLSVLSIEDRATLELQLVLARE